MYSEILADYPYLESEAIFAALEFAAKKDGLSRASGDLLRFPVEAGHPPALAR